MGEITIKKGDILTLQRTDENGEKIGRYTAIQRMAVKMYNIDLCDGTRCKNDWSRTHAHVRIRRICKWISKNSIQSTFELLHEIGHIETTKSTMRRCESEFYATVWAIKAAEDIFGLTIPESIIDDYQAYIDEEHDRGVRRGGKLPSLKYLNLKYFWKGSNEK